MKLLLCTFETLKTHEEITSLLCGMEFSWRWMFKLCSRMCRMRKLNTTLDYWAYHYPWGISSAQKKGTWGDVITIFLAKVARKRTLGLRNIVAAKSVLDQEEDFPSCFRRFAPIPAKQMMPYPLSPDSSYLYPQSSLENMQCIVFNWQSGL